MANKIVNTPAPMFALVDGGEWTLLDVHALGTTPFVYVLALRGNPSRGIGIVPETIQFFAHTLGARDEYCLALKTHMEYQHLDPRTRPFIDNCHKEIADFRRRMAEMEKSR